MMSTTSEMPVSPGKPHHSPRHFALIPAAGVGARMAASCPKQYLSILGQPVLWHTVQAFLQSPGIDHTFVVVSGDDGYIGQVFPEAVPGLTILRCGGATRADSVRQGLQAMLAHPLAPLEPAQEQAQPQAEDWVLVHDAARCGLTPALIARLQNELAGDEVGGLLALPVVDTVKQVSAGSVRTIPRDGLWLAQTPQMFRHQTLLHALQAAQANPSAVTDEASAMEMQGLVPRLVPGHMCNMKLTVPDDLVLLTALMRDAAA